MATPLEALQELQEALQALPRELVEAFDRSLERQRERAEAEAKGEDPGPEPDQELPWYVSAQLRDILSLGQEIMDRVADSLPAAEALPEPGTVPPLTEEEWRQALLGSALPEPELAPEEPPAPSTPPEPPPEAPAEDEPAPRQESAAPPWWREALDRLLSGLGDFFHFAKEEDLPQAQPAPEALPVFDPSPIDRAVGEFAALQESLRAARAVPPAGPPPDGGPPGPPRDWREDLPAWLREPPPSAEPAGPPPPGPPEAPPAGTAPGPRPVPPEALPAAEPAPAFAPGQAGDDGAGYHVPTPMWLRGLARLFGIDEEREAPGADLSGFDAAVDDFAALQDSLRGARAFRASREAEGDIFADAGPGPAASPGPMAGPDFHPAAGRMADSVGLEHAPGLFGGDPAGMDEKEEVIETLENPGISSAPLLERIASGIERLVELAESGGQGGADADEPYRPAFQTFGMDRIDVSQGFDAPDHPEHSPFASGQPSRGLFPFTPLAPPGP